MAVGWIRGRRARGDHSRGEFEDEIKIIFLSLLLALKVYFYKTIVP